MAIITNYATLVQAIKDAAEDDGQEFADYIPVAIDLAEEKLFKELDLKDLEDKETGTLTDTVNTLSKPSGFKFMHHFAIEVSGNWRTLKKVEEDFLIDYWPNDALTDTPKYYTESSETLFTLAPTPNNNNNYSIKYSKKPTKLSTTNTTNYYTDNCVDLLFFAAMIEMLKFMKSESTIPVWQQDFIQAKEHWNIQAMRKRRDDLEIPNSPDTGPNTIKHVLNTRA